MCSSDLVQAWIIARAGSEAFKREMFLYRAQTGPYADPATNVADRRALILEKVKEALPYVARQYRQGWSL